MTVNQTAETPGTPSEQRGNLQTGKPMTKAEWRRAGFDVHPSTPFLDWLLFAIIVTALAALFAFAVGR